MQTRASPHLARCCAAVALAALVLPARARAQSAPVAAVPSARYAGRFAFAGGPAERVEADRAVERAVEGMFFVVAAIARGRLHDNAQPFAHVVLRFTPGQIVVDLDGRGYVSPDDGRRIAARLAGEAPIRLAQYWENGHLVQIAATDQGYRRLDLVLADDDRTLTMQVQMVGAQLPHPLRFAYTFRR